MELVSIIMPMHNAERFIDRAITSVIEQTWQSWELLVVDDASTDRSVSIVKEYEKRDSRIHLLVNKNHVYMPSAPRNLGVQHAKGRFIAFLDSDDCWLPNKLEEQIPLFEDSEVAIVYSNYEKMSEDGKRNNRIVYAPKVTNYEKLLCGNIIGNLTGVYDTKKVGKILFNDIHHEDYVMWLSILKRGHIAKNTNTVTAIYRVRKQSVSSKKLYLLTWQWNIYRSIEHLDILHSIYYYVNYAIRAFLKSLK